MGAEERTRTAPPPLTRSVLAEAVLVSLPLLLVIAWISWRHREVQIGWFSGLYGGDGWRVARDLTSTPGSLRRWAHPLMVPLLGVPGEWLRSTGLSERLVASAWTHLFTALSLVGWQLVLRSVGCGRLLRVTGAVLLGGSFGMLTYGAVPETYHFGLAVLLWSTLLCVRRCDRRLPWVATGTLAVGFSLLHLAPWALCRWFSLRGRLGSRLAPVMKEGALALAVVAAITAAYEFTLGRPDRFLPSVAQESTFLSLRRDPWSRLQRIGEASSSALRAPRPTVRMGLGARHGRRQRGTADLGQTGLSVGNDPGDRTWWPAALLAAMLVAGAVRFRGDRGRLVRLCLAQLGFFLALHLVYGDAFLPSSQSWLYCLLLAPLLWAVRWRWLQGPLLLGAALLLWGNLQVSRDLLSTLSVLRNEGWWSLDRSQIHLGQRFLAHVELPWQTARARLTEVDPAADRHRWPPGDLPRLGPEVVVEGTAVVPGRFPEDAEVGRHWVSVVLAVDDESCRVLGYSHPRRLWVLPSDG